MTYRYENPYNVPKWKKYWRRFSYWFSGLGWIICSIVLLVSLMLWTEFNQLEKREKEYNAFMHECVKDRKEYECKAMWRAGNPEKDTHYIYLPN